MGDGEHIKVPRYRYDDRPGHQGPLPPYSWETPLPCNTREGDDETQKAFSAFQIFLSLPPHKRTVAETERTAKALDPDIAVTQFRFWSARWRWQERARQYMAHMARADREAKEQRIREMALRHSSIGASLLTVADKRLKQLEEKPAYLDPKDVVSFVETGVKIQRQAEGLEGKGAAENAPAAPTVQPTEAMLAALQNPQFRAAAAQMLAELEAAEENKE
jgi:hypothetical protein